MSDIHHQEDGAAPVVPAYIRFNKGQILSAMKVAGTEWARIEFDGESDEGRITAHSNVPAGSLNVLADDDRDTTPRTITMHAAMEQMALDLLELHHYGWEIGGGSYGVVVFDPVKGTITLEYSERIIDTEYYEHEV